MLGKFGRRGGDWGIRVWGPGWVLGRDWWIELKNALTSYGVRGRTKTGKINVRESLSALLVYFCKKFVLKFHGASWRKFGTLPKE